MLLEILHFPDARLRERAKPIPDVDSDIRRLADNMLETMYDAPGIGLAATQVNLLRRIIVLDISDDKDAPLCLINPRIVSHDGLVQMEEGCLSVPGVFEPVDRAQRIRVAALDIDGQPFSVEADGLLAVCIQHEIDHLDGRLFVDHLSSMKRNRIRKRLEKEKRRRQLAPAL
jgi:peptide deformylase